jgi:hypothetical protein
VFGFGPTATGNATPSVEFTSPLWTVGCCTLASSYYGNQIGVPQLALR